MKHFKREDASGVVPFYSDPDLSTEEFINLSTRALHTIAHVGLHYHVILVDDGLTLRGNVDIQHLVSTVKVKTRLGKAGAVRKGLREALFRFPESQFFIQTDFDGDSDSIPPAVFAAGLP